MLKSPSKILQQLCDILEIPFDENMLSWEAGARKEDGVWANYWYANVHQSIGFKKYTPKEINLNPALEALAKKCQPHYDFLYQKCLK